MKKFATWFPILAVTALVLTAAAPSKRSATEPGVESPSGTPAEAESSPSLDQPTSDASATTAPTNDQLDSDRPVAPTAASSPNAYDIDWYSINGGGTVNASSTNYRMGASIGQSVAGSASSVSYIMGIGFWYGASAPGGCACDCHGNPVCDAAICDVLDVVSGVNVAFRNFPPAVDPNAACPYQMTDVDCSGFTTVIDVVKFVNVAFRNGNPAVEFCNPCL